MGEVEDNSGGTSHQRGALQEDIGRHSGVVRRRCRGAGLGYRESLVAEALREGDDSTESRWRSLADASPEAREPLHLASALSEILEDYRHGPSEFEGSIQRNWTKRTRAEAPTQGKRFGASWL